MLPSDITAWKKQEESKQGQIEAHLFKKQATETVVPYSDELFQAAAVQWLVGTEQVGIVFILLTPSNTN